MLELVWCQGAYARHEWCNIQVPDRPSGLDMLYIRVCWRIGQPSSSVSAQRDCVEHRAMICRRVHNGTATGLRACFEMTRHLFTEMPRHEGAQNGGEDTAAAVVRHVGHCQQAEVAQQAVGDGVAAAPWGPHGCNKLGVDDLLKGTGRPPLIPTLHARWVNATWLCNHSKARTESGCTIVMSQSACVLL